jgi:hypothetical protein
MSPPPPPPPPPPPTYLFFSFEKKIEQRSTPKKKNPTQRLFGFFFASQLDDECTAKDPIRGSRARGTHRNNGEIRLED